MKKEEKKIARDYYVRVKVMINKMATLGEKIKKEEVIKKVLRTLTEKYDHTILIIKEIKDLSTIKIYNLTLEERVLKRVREGTSNSDDQEFSIKENENQGRGQGRDARGRGISGRGGRRGSFGRGRGRE